MEPHEIVKANQNNTCDVKLIENDDVPLQGNFCAENIPWVSVNYNCGCLFISMVKCRH